jgi:hypothetical protein
MPPLFTGAEFLEPVVEEPQKLQKRLGARSATGWMRTADRV